MNVVIPKELEKKLREKARKFDMTEHEYVRSVLARAVGEEGALDDEMRMWRDKSRRDTLTFWKKHKL